jgi:predicted GNAT family acetyltransferase
VIHAQAAMALETCGVDPLKRDPAGFREHYLNRIEKKRVWVVIENDRLLFKADIIADTPDAVYVEGVYVSPEERGKGVGRRCLAGLGRILMARGKAIYLFVESQNTNTRGTSRSVHPEPHQRSFARATDLRLRICRTHDVTPRAV